MEDFNQKATKEIADMMHYVAEDAVKNAPYDKTRNARVTKVYTEGYVFDEYISGYDVDVDGRSYHLTKERGKGVIAKVNDVVKLHFPCDNSNLMYISYSHDPEDYISRVDGTQYGFVRRYYGGDKDIFMRTETEVTFPATTKQFSKTTIAFGCEEVGIELGTSELYTYSVYCNKSIIASVNAINSSDFVVVNLYNENPDTVNPVTKTVKVMVVANRHQY